MHNDLKLFNELACELLSEEQTNPVSPYIKSKKLSQIVDISLGEEALTDEKLKLTLQELIHYTPKTASKAFFNQLFGGRVGKAVLGDLLAVMFNNSMYTYKAAGIQTGIEKSIVDTICNIIGYKDKFSGSIAPGGSMSNLMAMITARDSKNRNISSFGIQKKMTLYTSEASHYSISKNASFIGVGRNQVRRIRTDDRGRMLVECLEKEILQDIKNNHQPFFVNVTLGTTVLGAFDDIQAASIICKKYNLWLHIDGAYCGAVIFSHKYKHLAKGIENSDSFTFNAHKILGVPLSCSIFVTSHKKQLYASFSEDAHYLYQTDDGELDLGKTSMQCGRRNDALKLWTLWKSVGTKGLESTVNHSFYLGEVARGYIRSHPDYKLYSFDDSISVCFNYKDINPEELCTNLYKHASLMVGFGEFSGIKFVRLVTINTLLDESDIIDFFKTLEQFVKISMA